LTRRGSCLAPKRDSPSRTLSRESSCPTCSSRSRSRLATLKSALGELYFHLSPSFISEIYIWPAIRFNGLSALLAPSHVSLSLSLSPFAAVSPLSVYPFPVLLAKRNERVREASGKRGKGESWRVSNIGAARRDVSRRRSINHPDTGIKFRRPSTASVHRAGSPLCSYEMADRNDIFLSAPPSGDRFSARAEIPHESRTCPARAGFHSRALYERTSRKRRTI